PCSAPSARPRCRPPPTPTANASAQVRRTGSLPSAPPLHGLVPIVSLRPVRHGRGKRYETIVVTSNFPNGRRLHAPLPPRPPRASPPPPHPTPRAPRTPRPGPVLTVAM